MTGRAPGLRQVHDRSCISTVPAAGHGIAASVVSRTRTRTRTRMPSA
ncbi:MAG: hypothetical protein HZA54_15510, partial [Planctomycetes bacterium]|nr:hypothetical protein [Planctomycetota bacterium]